MTAFLYSSITREKRTHVHSGKRFHRHHELLKQLFWRGHSFLPIDVARSTAPFKRIAVLRIIQGDAPPTILDDGLSGDHVRSMFVKKNLVKSRARFSGVKFIVLGFDVTRLHSSGIKNCKSEVRKNDCPRTHLEYALIFILKVGNWIEAS